MNISNISTNNSSIDKEPRSCKYEEPDPAIEGTLKRTVLILMYELAIANNIFIIILAVKYTVRKNLHHLITNMAVSDSLYLFMNLLLDMHWLSNDKWSIYPNGKMGAVMCKIVLLIYHTSFRVSLFTLLVISIERFRATRQTLHRLRPYTLKKRMAVLGVCWLIPIMSAVPFVYYSKQLGEKCFIPYAEISYNIFFGIITVTPTISMVLQCCVIFVLCILTIRRLSRPNAIQAHVNQERQKIRASRLKAAVRMVLFSTLLYVCCWPPYFVYIILFLLHNIFPSISIIDHSLCIDWPSLWFVMFHFLPILNSFLSPCIYIIFLSDFREAAKKVICKKTTLNEANKRRNSIELQPIDNPHIEHDRRRCSDDGRNVQL